ncbi:MAG: TIGR00282 family metallophosphoesterase [Acholeplasmataceae bacterium]|nr:TIGR00282 family metallophosphoesterase [Acholeplasmataceae bacterium]
MKILFIGDIYGDPGLEMINEHLPELKRIHKPNLIIVNAENAANGRGITKKIYKELMSLGVSVITMGNWTWGNRELFEFIDESKIVRPLNYRAAPGSGFVTLNYNDQKVCIINALGRTFMNAGLDDPFTGIKDIIESEKADISFVDFHAEATSEKVALGHYLDGIADVVVGTHTHVPTADERRLPKGTLYITDVGMTGPLDGIIGVNRDIVLNRFLNGYSTPNQVAEGPKQLNAVMIDLHKKTIKRIHIQSETV